MTQKQEKEVVKEAGFGKIVEHFSWGTLSILAVFVAMALIMGKEEIQELKNSVFFIHFPLYVAIGFVAASVKNKGPILATGEMRAKYSWQIPLIFSRFVGSMLTGLVGLFCLMSFKHGWSQLWPEIVGIAFSIISGYLTYQLMGENSRSNLSSAIFFAVLFYAAAKIRYGLSTFPILDGNALTDGFYSQMLGAVFCGTFFCSMEYREKFPIGKMVSALSALLLIELFMLSSKSGQEAAASDLLYTTCGLLIGYVPMKLVYSLKNLKEKEEEKEKKKE